MPDEVILNIRVGDLPQAYTSVRPVKVSPASYGRSGHVNIYKLFVKFLLPAFLYRFA